MSCLGCFPCRDHVDDILDNTKVILDAASEALSNAPIPGLDAAAGGLSAILDRVIVSANHFPTKPS